MSVKIYISTHDTWAFFQENKERLAEEQVMIAENTETGYAVYVTEEYGKPHFSVCKDNNPPEYEEYAINEIDCVDVLKDLYMKYLFPVIVVENRTDYEKDYNVKDILDPDEDMEYSLANRSDMEDERYMREDELFLATIDFLDVVLGVGENGFSSFVTQGGDFIDDVLDHICEYLAEEYGAEIYRPTFRTEDDGTEIYVEYPYNDGWDESMIYADVE